MPTNNNNGAMGMMWAQAGANAANTLLGIGAARVGAGYDRKQQLKTQAALNEMSRREQMGIMDYNQKLQMEMWDKTSFQYNKEMDRMKATGLNPALMYGMGGGGGMTGQIGGGGGFNAPSAGVIDTTHAGSSGIGMNVLTAAQVKLMEAQARNLNVDADKKAGVDTENVKADTVKKLADTGNTQADTALKQIETNIARIDEWIKDKSKGDVTEQIMWTAQKSMNEVENMWRQNLLNKAQYEDKVQILKTELAGKLLENTLTEQKTDESKSNVEVNKAQISKMAQDVAQGWEKLSQTEKIMKVDGLMKEYDNMFKGKIGSWRISNPETIAKQIDKIMGLEKKDFK